MKKIILLTIIFCGLGIYNLSNAQSFATESNNYNGFSVEAHDAKLYPNPVTDQELTISSTHYNIISIEIINVIGQTIQRKQNDAIDKSIKLNIVDCEKGIYLTKITFDDNKSIIKKIMIR